MYLCSLAVVLELAGEAQAVEPLEHLGHALGGVRQHRLERDARSEAAVLRQRSHSLPQYHRDDHVVVRTLAVHIVLKLYIIHLPYGCSCIYEFVILLHIKIII